MRRGNFFQIVNREVLGHADVLKSRDVVYEIIKENP